MNSTMTQETYMTWRCQTPNSKCFVKVKPLRLSLGQKHRRSVQMYQGSAVIWIIIRQVYAGRHHLCHKYLNPSIFSLFTYLILLPLPSPDPRPYSAFQKHSSPGHWQTLNTQLHQYLCYTVCYMLHVLNKDNIGVIAWHYLHDIISPDKLLKNPTSLFSFR